MSEDDEKIAITPAWLNYKQAEAYANLSRTTLWQLISARKIRAARIGRAVRIERDSLQAFMEQSTEDSEDRPDGYDGTRVQGDSASAILPNLDRKIGLRTSCVRSSRKFVV